MIKYVELTAPEASAFRQAKILSIECNEGDRVEQGHALFRVKSGSKEIDLPSTQEGRVVEVIATLQQNITLSTPLILLETEVVASTASSKAPQPHGDTDPKPATIERKRNTNNKKARKKRASKKKHQQQSLDLLGEQEHEVVLDQVIAPTPQTNEENVADPHSMGGTSASSQTMTSPTTKITVPDIGTDSAKVIDILVKVGDNVTAEDPLITLESDKASMDVPSTHTGTVTSISVLVDQDVSEGTEILELEVADSAEASPSPADTAPSPELDATEPTHPAKPKSTVPESSAPAPQPAPAAVSAPAGNSHASPAIRRFARELGVDLSGVTGSGRKNRITKDDVKAYVKGQMSQTMSPATQQGAGIPPIPAQDFSKFGDIEIQPLNKIKRLTASNLHRSWVNVPHVTHNDEADISDLESFRKQLNTEYAKQGKSIKLSPLAFIVKAVVNALQAYPQFNSSLEPQGENLILKKYFNIGIAVDTPDGLVVPVIKNADKKSVADIAQEMGQLAQKARDKKLTMNDMSGACFTISSLGGIGGTGFTPIVNAPEVAILGVSRSKITPVWDGNEFKPGTILPLSLSYDHRVIDGAEAARFARHIAAVLEDLRRLTI